MFVAFVGAGSSDGVLARVLDQHATVWGEYSLALTPAINGVGGRQQISHRRSQFVPNLVDVSCKYCYSCGGAYPTFGGYVRSWGDTPYELYIGCSSGYALGQTLRRIFAASKPGFTVRVGEPTAGPLARISAQRCSFGVSRQSKMLDFRILYLFS